MTKMIVTSSSEDPDGMMDIVLKDAVFKAVNSLLGVKMAFARLARLMAAMDTEGTINGVDIYEAVQGVHDFTASAISYLVPPEEMEKLDKIKLDDDAQFEKLVSMLEQGGGHG